MNRRTKNRISALLLLLGLGSALVIFLAADPTQEDPLLNDPRAAKKFHHELQVIGGKANLLSAEFQDWFDGLWQGRTLAGTVGVLTVGATLIFRFAASFHEIGPVPAKSGVDPASRETGGA